MTVMMMMMISIKLLKSLSATRSPNTESVYEYEYISFFVEVIGKILDYYFKTADRMATIFDFCLLPTRCLLISGLWSVK